MSSNLLCMALSNKQALTVSQHKPRTTCGAALSAHLHPGTQVSSRMNTTRISAGGSRAVDLPGDSAHSASASGAAAEAEAEAAATPQKTTRPPIAVTASGAVFVLAGLSKVVYQALLTEPLPPLGPTVHVMTDVLGWLAVSAAATLGSAKLLLGDTFHIELHRGRLYVQSGVPSQGPAVNPAECIVTRPTGDVRGNGAYATAVIPSGSHISDYSGQLLNKAQFYAKYPDGVGNYAMAIDQQWVIDAADSAPCTAAFHPVHMNHSRSRANVLRYYSRREGRVAFFAARDIHPGEELLYDYGRAYWRGREHLELP